MYAKFEKKSVNKYSSYRSEMVSTDGPTDGRTDTEGYNIIPRHTLVAGYKNEHIIEYLNNIYVKDMHVNIDLYKYDIFHKMSI